MHWSKMNKKEKIQIVVSILVVLFIFATLSAFYNAANQKDKQYKDCLKTKAEVFCYDKNGIYKFDPWKPHVQCMGTEQNAYYFFGGQRPIYIFNKTEIADCWGD